MTMRIGGKHRWKYNTRWNERKTRPGTWTFNATQTKHRLGKQMHSTHSTPIGTTFHWKINARQKMTKIGPNTYRGSMQGHKRFVSRRP